MRNCQKTQTPSPTANSYTGISPWVLSYVSYPYECCTSQNCCALCCRAQIRVSGMSQATLEAGIEYFRLSEKQSRYFDEDLPGQGVNFEEFISPGGRRK